MSRFNPKALATHLERLIAQLPQQLDPGRVPDRKPPRRIIREPSADGLAVMLAEYTDGANISELASKHRYSRIGIADSLKGAGVQLRRQGHPVDQAIHLYEAGQSLIRFGERFGVNASTVWARLLQQGVTMRPASQQK